LEAAGNDRVEALKAFAGRLEKDWVYGKIMTEAAKLMYLAALEHVEAGNFRKALPNLADTGVLMQNSSQYADLVTQRECDDYAKLIRTKKSFCEAKLLIMTADEEAAKVGATTKVDLIAQKYLSAIDLVQSFCKDTEGFAATRLGLVYMSAKLKEKAMEYFNYALNVAKACKTKELNATSWYREAFSKVEALQREQHRAETEKFEKMREDFKTTHWRDLDILKRKADAGADRFLEHIYTVYPPKDVSYILPAINSSNLKTLVKKAMHHYHSDKQSRQSHEWQLICEEISKNLAAKLEVLNRIS